MKTRLPFSTITYNTPAFLTLKLNELVKAKILSFWSFVQHEPEDDETKKHIHLYCVPAKTIQTDDLKCELSEFDATNPNKPLTCITARQSKSFADWYLYSMHDPIYLASKNECRRYVYKRIDLCSSDNDEANVLIREIDLSPLTSIAAMKEAILGGYTFEEFFSRGSVPLQQTTNAQRAWDILFTQYQKECAKTARNGRESHS